MPGNGESGVSAISANGRVVRLPLRRLQPGGQRRERPARRRVRAHLRTGQTTRASKDSRGREGNGRSFDPAISATGRYVAFVFESTFVGADTNAVRDVYLRDRRRGATRRVSVGSRGAQGDADSHQPDISADGAVVAFDSYATNLVRGDTNGARDVFVRNRRAGTTSLVSRSPSGRSGNDVSEQPAISGNGRYVAFASIATDLVPGDVNATEDVFTRDRREHRTRLEEESGGTRWRACERLQFRGRPVLHRGHRRVPLVRDQPRAK